MTACEFLRDKLLLDKMPLHTVMEKLHWWERHAIIICYRPHWTKSDLLGKPHFLYSTNCLPVHSGPWQPSRCQSNYPLFTADLLVSLAIFFPSTDDRSRSGWGRQQREPGSLWDVICPLIVPDEAGGGLQRKDIFHLRCIAAAHANLTRGNDKHCF